jgi:hypothetical protein
MTMTVPPAIASGGPPAAALLAQSSFGLPGLYRRHPERNLSAVAATILGAFSGTGHLRLGRSRSLAVIAVDGLGFAHAARSLTPDLLTTLTSEFPTTTIACLLTSLTGQPTDSHGFIGVQFLHTDGLRTVNCHTGQLEAPAADAAARPTVTPAFPTVFDIVSGQGVRTVAVPNELGLLDAGIRDRLLHGAQVIADKVVTAADPPGLVRAFADQLTAAIPAGSQTLTWAYLDLDSHVHRHGFGQPIDDAVAALGRLAASLSQQGTAVLIFSDHGLTPNQPATRTLDIWQQASDARWCRLPPGGAGRVRWLYPRTDRADRLLAWLTDEITDAVVAVPEQVAQWGLVRAGSIGQRRLGEIVLLARGPDFPAPDTATRFEHGSMTADEILVPMAIWQPAR